MSPTTNTPRVLQQTGADATITDRFLRSAGVARAVGWGVSCPVFLVLFSEAKAAPHWYGLALVAAYVYPAVMAWMSPRAASPVRMVMAGHILESLLLAVFAEVACTDPVFVLVALSVVVINAGVTRGRRGAGVVMLTFLATSATVFERFRAVETIAPPVYVHVLLGLFLLGYVSIVSHQAYALVVRNATNKRALTRQRNQLDSLHQHLVETISNPFVSAEAVLAIIGPELTPDEAGQYLERIRARQRWEAIGRQTRSLAHDANNLLVPILMTGELLGEKLSHDDEATDCLADLESAVRQLEALHRQMNPRDQGPDPTGASAELQQGVNEVVAMVRASVPPSLVVHLQDALPGGPVRVRLDPSSLHRCLLNLCINAVQAMQESGTLTLTLRSASAPERQRLRSAADGYAVEVSDTGPGIPDDVAERVFNPYFTTRTEQGGTGLGLATSHALVTDAGGTLAFESTPTTGTVFTLVLPVGTDG